MNKILFSEEAHFHLDDNVNQPNYQLYSNKKRIKLFIGGCILSSWQSDVRLRLLLRQSFFKPLYNKTVNTGYWRQYINCEFKRLKTWKTCDFYKMALYFTGLLKCSSFYIPTFRTVLFVWAIIIFINMCRLNLQHLRIVQIAIWKWYLQSNAIHVIHSFKVRLS